MAPAVQRFVDTICELPSSVMGKLNWTLVPLVGRYVANGFEKMSRIYFEQPGPLEMCYDVVQRDVMMLCPADAEMALKCSFSLYI